MENTQLDAVIDVAGLLGEVSAQQPCGPDLEYDPDYLELERELKGKAETHYGAEMAPATPPDWQRVLRLALRLTQRSRDLRIAVVLCRALLKQHGWSGFAAGLRLIEQLLQQRWDSVHPQLDPDDGNDPLPRVNVLAALASPAMLLPEVRAALLVSSRAHGNFSMRDIDIGSGELEAPPGTLAPSPASVAAASRRCAST